MSRVDDPRIGPLSPAVVEMLGAYREHHAMPKDAHARVRRMLEEAPVSTPAPRRFGLATVTFAAAAAVVLGLVAAEAWRAAPSEVRSPRDLSSDVAPKDPAAHPTTPVPATSVVPAELGMTAPLPASAPEVGAPRPEGRPSAMRREVADPSATAASPASSLAAERKLLAEANDALGARDLSRVRAIVARHAREFPGGVLLPELSAVRTMARCLEQPTNAKAELDAFVRAQPGSVLLSSVREACGEEKNRDE